MNRLVLLGLALVLLAGLVVAGWNWQQQRVVQQAYAAGMAAADADNYEEALALALPYADRHDPDIDHLLGMIYINGPDGIKDIDKGLTYRRAAADAGNMQAAYYLGRWLIEMDSTEEAVTEGLHYIQQAVDCGMPMANYFLGYKLVKGEDVGKDLTKGLEYAEFAAWAGIAPSQTVTTLAYALAAKERNGESDKDSYRRLYWLVVSADNGDPIALEILDEVFQEFRSKDDSSIDDLVSRIRAEATRRSNEIRPPDIYSCGFKPPTS